MDDLKQRIKATLAQELMLDTPAAVRFVSCEPMLEPFDLTFPGNLLPTDQEPRLDWVICGGESGPGHRPFDPDWARDLLEQCDLNRTPFFMKQLGGIRLTMCGRSSAFPVSKLICHM